MDAKVAVVDVWIVWGVSWVLAAAWSKPTVKSVGGAREIPYRLLQALGLVMVFASLNETGGPQSDGAQGLFSLLFAQLWDVPETIAWGAPVLAGCGFAFAWWARLHLGALWSSSVTRKEDHRIVDSGPYGIVRHPIYTGMLIGTLALVAVSGRVLALAGFAILALGIYIKARLEERFLSAELGADAYSAYRSRVPMLVPGAPA